jgi:hypothetical protein
MTDGYGGYGTYDLCRYIGQTVTIFTQSGGVTGCGFTGVLMSVNDCYVRLLTSVGAAPDCPIGSRCCKPSCDTSYGNYGGNYGGCGNYLGSVIVIPKDKIVSFCHNAI